MSDALNETQTRFLKLYLGVSLNAAGNACDVPSPGLVEKRKFLVTRWQQLVSDLDVELKTLCGAIPDLVPYENPSEIEAGVNNALKPFLQDLVSRINDAVDVSINAGDGKYAAVAAAVGQVREVCRGNELMAALRENTLAAGAGFEAAVESALTEIEGKLTA